jgi:hypothetical protein
MWEPQTLATLRASTACIRINLPFIVYSCDFQIYLFLQASLISPARYVPRPSPLTKNSSRSEYVPSTSWEAVCLRRGDTNSTPNPTSTGQPNISCLLLLMQQTTYSQPPSISGRHYHQPYTEDAPCRDWQKVQINTDREAFVKWIKLYVKDFIMMEVPNWGHPFASKTYTWMRYFLQRALILVFSQGKNNFLEENKKRKLGEDGGGEDGNRRCFWISYDLKYAFKVIARAGGTIPKMWSNVASDGRNV